MPHYGGLNAHEESLRRLRMLESLGGGSSSPIKEAVAAGSEGVSLGTDPSQRGGRGGGETNGIMSRFDEMREREHQGLTAKLFSPHTQALLSRVGSKSLRATNGTSTSPCDLVDDGAGVGGNGTRLALDFTEGGEDIGSSTDVASSHQSHQSHQSHALDHDVTSLQSNMEENGAKRDNGSGRTRGRNTRQASLQHGEVDENKAKSAPMTNEEKARLRQEVTEQQQAILEMNAKLHGLLRVFLERQYKMSMELANGTIGGGGPSRGGLTPKGYNVAWATGSKGPIQRHAPDQPRAQFCSLMQHMPEHVALCVSVLQHGKRSVMLGLVLDRIMHSFSTDPSLSTAFLMSVGSMDQVRVGCWCC